LADVPGGGDLAFMVYHYLCAYFPIESDQVLKYSVAEFSINPTSAASVAAQKWKVAKVFMNIIK
jgi:hypothetical protein